MATDRSNSVLQEHEKNFDVARLYSPYGFELTSSLPAVGFNGEVPHRLTLNYGLGLGYRTYSPASMRFQSPDDWSPFGRGGINSYAYCFGDPVNRTDPSGHSGIFIQLLKGLGNRLGLRKRSSQLPANVQLLQVSPAAADKNSETPALPKNGSTRTASGRNDSEIRAWIDASFSEKNFNNSLDYIELDTTNALKTIRIGKEWSSTLAKGIRQTTLMKMDSNGKITVLR